MKRYLVFLFTAGWEQGGMCDYKGSYDTIEEAMNYIDERRDPDVAFGQVLDRTDGKIIINEV